MMNRTAKICVLTAMVFASLGLVTSKSYAGLLPVNVSSSSEGTDFRYNYGVVLTSDSKLNNGDFFTIFDFAGLKPMSSTQPMGWTFSSGPTGGNPAQTVPNDDAMLPNLTWTYSGPQLSGQVGLGTFSAVSNFAPSDTRGDFASQTHSSATGSAEKNVTDTLTPLVVTTMPVDPVPPGVPEPSTIALLGIGLPFAVRYFRGKKKETV